MKNWNFKFRIASILLLFQANVLIAETLVGELPGSVSVDNTGAASYVIPLSLPPGTAGLQPELSVRYSSQGGNGLMGLGFSLSGLSAIYRSPSTELHDGVKDGIDFDGLDRLVMDGQRLMVVPTNAVYGADGTQYRTEIDSFSKITLHGDMNSADSWFEVHTKSGLIYEYGHTADSFVEPEGRTNALSWSVNKISDTAGNYMLFQYSESAGEPHLLTNLVYTGNAAESLTPYNEVKFLYEDRDDARTGYMNGSQFYATKRLQSVVVSGVEGTITDYSLLYTNSAVNGFSLLSSVEQSFGTNSIPPTIFEWGDDRVRCENWINTGAGSWGSDEFTFTGDFNGDGRSDLVSGSGTNIYLKLGTDTTFIKVTGSVPPGTWKTGFSWAQDFTGDGRMDIITKADNGNLNLLISTGAGFQPLSASILNPRWGTADFTWTADFDGDGVADIASASGTNVYMKLTGETWTVPNQWGSADFTWTGDFNGDGMSDIASASSGNVYMKFSTGSGFNSETWAVANQWGSKDYTRVGDFNGDGLMDIASANGGNVYMKLSTGTNFVSSTWTIPNVWGSASATWVLDFNRDGLSDFATVKNNNIYLYQSTGDGFVQTVYTGYGDFGGASSFRVGDFTGDGNPDIVSILGTDIYKKKINPDVEQRIVRITKGYRSESLHGAVTEIEYLPITNTNIYEKGSDTPYGSLHKVQAPLYVVSALGRDDGTGGTYRSDYTYAEASYHRSRGYLGFRVFRSYDLQTGLSQVEILEQAFPWTGSPISTETWYTPDPAQPEQKQLIKEVRNTWLYDTVQNGTIFPYVAESVEKKWGLGQTNSPISEVTAYNWFDDQSLAGDLPVLIQPTNAPQNISYGNIAKIVMDYGDGAKQISSNQYYSVNTNTWLLGRLAASTVTHVLSGSPSITKTSSFDYNATTGLLNEEVIEPGHPTLEQTTSYAYDGFGNITNKTISAPGITSRSVQQNEYDPRGRFVTEPRNTIGHAETVASDQSTGVVLSKTGPNNLTTSWQYDPLGRALFESRADGTSTSTEYAWDSSVTVSASDPAGSTNVLSQTSSYKITRQSSGAAPATVWYDNQSREIRQMTLSPAGDRQIFQDTVYNGFGQIAAASENYFSGDTYKVGTYEYDGLGRKKYLTLPDGTVTEYVYDGLTTQVIADSDHRTTGEPPKNQITTTIQNAQGQTLQVIDNLNNALSYEYDAAGNLIKTTDPATNIIEMVYDIRGNKIAQTDPDMGSWSYAYNAIGELVSQTNAAGQSVSMEYDLLGRMTRRVTSEGEARWYYDGDTEGCWAGALRREELRDRFGDLTYRKTYAYDSFGRPMLELYNYDNKWYYTSYRYDQYSRLKFTDRFWRPQSVLASGDNLSTEWNVFTTVNTFNQYGILTKVSDSTGHDWWQIDEDDFDAKGHLLEYTLGNDTITTKTYDTDTGYLTAITTRNASSQISDIQNDLYTLDRLGNLMSRRNLRQLLLQETFTYDGLNRLTDATVQSSVSNSTSYAVSYNALGNILTKTGVGSYTYGQNGAGSHAVTSVDGGAGSITTYSYDANGNMLGRSVNGSNTLTTVWTSFSKPKTIYSGLNGSRFTYDTDNNRITQLIETDDGLNKSVKKKIYIAGMEQDEEVLNPNDSEVSWNWQHKQTRIFVSTPSGSIGIHVQDANETVTRKYFHADHLGSITVVTGEKSGDTAAILAEYSFDAWGARRDATTWEPLVTPPATLATDRGFTGHEMLDHLGLVHMNGRIYDAHLGRFLSADPTLQFPANLQDYNRYSYVGNNPLRYTDPSGYGWFSSLWKKITHAVSKYWKVIVTIVVAVVAAIVAPYLLGIALNSFWGMVVAGVAGGFAGSFTGTLLNGGSLGDALKAGFEGAAWGGVAGAAGGWIQAAKWASLCKALAQGVTGSAISFAQGGSLESGFLAGFAGGWASGQFNSWYGKAFAGAIVGGCASLVGGGKFESGAVAGAFVALVTSSLENYLTEQGQPVYADGASTNSGDYGKGTTILNNGVGTSRAAFQLEVNQAYASNPGMVVGFYNPSNGLISDILQAAWQKVLFGVGDSLAYSLGQFSNQFSSPHVVGYSQGGLTVANSALRGSLPKGSSISFRSSAVSVARGEFSGRIHGIDPAHNTPWGDIINIVAPNPFKAVTAPYDILTGFSIHKGNR